MIHIHLQLNQNEAHGTSQAESVILAIGNNITCISILADMWRISNF
mgnify:CR=1 FL=1